MISGPLPLTMYNRNRVVANLAHALQCSVCLYCQLRVQLAVKVNDTRPLALDWLTKVIESPIKHGYKTFTSMFILPISLEVNDTRARVRIAQTYGHCKTWIGSPNYCPVPETRILNGAKLHCVFSFPRKTVRIAVFPDKCIPDKRGFIVVT